MKSDVLLFPFLLFLIQNVHGFLLEGPINGEKQTTANSQFLTNTEFLQAKQVLKQNTDDLRHDMDKTFALMTSQLKSKFDLLETKLADVDKRNETSNNGVSMEKYIALEQKLTIAEQKITNVQRENDRMKQENVVVKNEIEQLKKLGAIKPLQEFAALQQSVNLNTDKIYSLSMNEQARSQDFLALYNLTTATGRKLTEMETSTNNLILQLENNQTIKMNNMKGTLDNQLTSFQTSYNSTINGLLTKEMSMQKQITENSEQVALFAWTSGKTGRVILFSNVKFSVGITNLSAFKNTGKFVCEKEGVYLIAATVASQETANFCITHNSVVVSCAEIGQHSSHAWYSGTSVIAQHLKVNDKINAESGFTIESGSWTHLTIVKIK